MKIVVIGGVAAGMSMASKLKRLKPEYEIEVYEKGHDLSYGACGMPYYLSDIIKDEKTLVARTKEEFEASGIKVFTGHEVTRLNPSEKSIEGLHLDAPFKTSYDQLVIATGASAIHIPVDNHHLKGIYPLNSLQDAIHLKEALKSAQTIAIIGAGFIGMEVAENMIHLGKNVHVIERLDQVLPTYDAIYAKRAEEALKNAGVMMHLNETLKGYEGEEKVKKVITDRQAIDVDLVIEAVGVRPNTHFLKDLGFEMLANGALVVNAKGQTNLKDIHAAGDCVAYPHVLTQEPTFVPLGTHANKMGRVIAEQLSGHKQAYFHGVIGSSILKVMDLTVSKTGLTMKDSERLNLGLKYVDVKAKNQAGYYPGAELMDIRLTYEPNTLVIKGAQIIGKKGVSDRINIMASVISQGLTKEVLENMDLAYSPPFQPVWDPLQIAAQQIK